MLINIATTVKTHFQSFKTVILYFSFNLNTKNSFNSLASPMKWAICWKLVKQTPAYVSCYMHLTNGCWIEGGKGGIKVGTAIDKWALKTKLLWNRFDVWSFSGWVNWVETRQFSQPMFDEMPELVCWKSLFHIVKGSAALHITSWYLFTSHTPMLTRMSIYFQLTIRLFRHNFALACWCSVNR